MLIDDDQRNQPGVEHFQQIFILQRFRRRLQYHRWARFTGKSGVQRLQAVVIAGGAANKDGLTRELLQLSTFGEAGPEISNSFTLL